MHPTDITVFPTTELVNAFVNPYDGGYHVQLRGLPWERIAIAPDVPNRETDIPISVVTHLRVNEFADRAEDTGVSRRLHSIILDRLLLVYRHRNEDHPKLHTPLVLRDSDIRHTYIAESYFPLVARGEPNFGRMFSRYSAVRYGG